MRQSRFQASVPAASRQEVEWQLERLERMRCEMRPPSRAEARLGRLQVCDRIDRWGNYWHIDPEAEEILGFPSSHYDTEVGWLRFNHPDDVWRTVRLWERALAGEAVSAVEYRTFNIEGKWVWLEDSFRPLILDSRRQALIIEGCWRDITRRKRCEVEFLLRHWEACLGPPRAACRGLVVRFPAPVPAPVERG
jgi:PAS domain S-box-containing protein